MSERSSAGSLLNPDDKIFSLEEAKKNIEKLRGEGVKAVFTNGCFDLLHGGHASYLYEARKRGDLLIVGINSDESITRLKGETRPVLPLDQRCRLIASFSFVDMVVPFGEDTPIKVIETLIPDVLVKGADWDENNIVGRDFVLSRGGEVLTVPLVEGISTSDIIAGIVKSYSDRF